MDDHNPLSDAHCARVLAKIRRLCGEIRDEISGLGDPHETDLATSIELTKELETRMQRYILGDPKPGV